MKKPRVLLHLAALAAGFYNRHVSAMQYAVPAVRKNCSASAHAPYEAFIRYRFDLLVFSI